MILSLILAIVLLLVSLGVFYGCLALVSRGSWERHVDDALAVANHDPEGERLVLAVERYLAERGDQR